jgi:hypothetical protein
MLRDLAACAECGGTCGSAVATWPGAHRAEVRWLRRHAEGRGSPRAAKASLSLRDLDQSLKGLVRTINIYLLDSDLSHGLTRGSRRRHVSQTGECHPVISRSCS